MNYNRGRYDDDSNRNPQPMRPIFEPLQLQDGIWQQIIPNKLKMIIVQPGQGTTPKVGQFIRVKQFIYKDDLKLIKQDRFTYIFGRKKNIQGIQYCLALCRQGFKARIYISYTLAYGDEQFQSIPPKSNLVFDIEVNSINLQPLGTSDYQDQLLIDEIICRAKQGDQLCKKAEYQKAKVQFQYAFNRIQSSRCLDIKGHLYKNQKIATKLSCKQVSLEEVEKQKAWLIQLLNIFDGIKIKTIEVLLLAKDYYNVIIYTKNCMMLGNKLELNPKLLLARAISLLEIGEFNLSLEIFQHLHDLYPSQSMYEQQLTRAKAKHQKCKKLIKQISVQPVLPLTKENKKKKYQIISVIAKIYEQDEQTKRIRQASKEQFFIDSNIYEDDI